MAQLNKKDIDTGNDHFSDDYGFKKQESMSNGAFKFNASAPEFVPRSQAATADQVPAAMTGYFFPCFQYVDGNSGGSWIYVTTADQETCTIPLVPDPKPNPKAAATRGQQQQHHHQQQHAKENALPDELKQKIIRQVEYQFSDMSLLANESFVKHVNKDPEGFVPINVVTSTKKLKSLNVSNQIVAQALRSSSKLIVSHDGKKVRRKQPFTEKEKEELQLRTVIAENLPDDHSHQNIEKIFNVVGSIKAIRICQPQEPNSSRSSKGDLVISNKLHALVEYENHETAEKAAEKLNDERNWRKGMRVRVMLKRSPKSVLKNRKSEFDGYLDHDEGSNHELHEDPSRPNVSESILDQADLENSVASKKTWAKNRAKPKHRNQLQTARSLPTTTSNLSCSFLGEITSKQIAKGPRMPDGTRGFTMGRGKPLSVPVQPS